MHFRLNTYRRHPGRKSCLFLLVLTLLVVPAEARDSFFVSPQGDDKNSGTLNSPWKSLQRAADSAGPGDTVLVRAGIYPAPLFLRRSGSKDSPIVFRNHPGEVPVIDGNGSTRFGIVLDQVGFVHVKGFRIREIKTPNPRAEEILHEQGGILLRQSSDCVVEGNQIATGGLSGYTEENPGATGIQLWSRDPSKACDRNLIRGNEVTHSAYAIHVRGPAQRNVFEGNYCHNNDELTDHSDALKFESINFELNHPRAHVASYKQLAEAVWAAHTPRNNTIRYTVAEANSDDGIDTWISVYNLIEYNLCAASGMGPKQGDGNGFKLGPGGHNRVRFNLSRDNRVKAFTDNNGLENEYENNLALGDRSDGAPGVLLVKDLDAWEQQSLRRDIESRIKSFYRELVKEYREQGIPASHLHRAADFRD